MILTQKYHSASEIDEEFIPGLEILLREYFPSFKWLVQREKLEPDSIHFTYYLFFGSKHNDPVGFAGLSIHKCDDMEPWYKKFFTKKEKTSQKIVDWSTLGNGEEAIIFDPMYAKPALNKTKELISSYFNRNDVSMQTITFSRAYSEISLNQFKSEKSEKKVANTLTKSGNNYQDYLTQRDQKFQQNIKTEWKKLSSTLDMDIGDFQNFKSVFEYRTEGQVLYKQLKKDPRIALHILEDTNYITFEKDNQIQAILFLIHGVKGHLFFDWKIFNPEVSQEMMIQLSIMKFYETESATYLHPLTIYELSKKLEFAGFSERNLIQMNFKKNQYAN